MDYCLSHYHRAPIVKHQRTHHHLSKSTPSTSPHRQFKPLKVVSGAGASHCEFGSLNSPLKPRSPVGKGLVSVLQNHPQLFHLAVADELKNLADDRDLARNRMVLNAPSDEACLYRRLAQLKENECQTAVEDVMYLLIIYKFSEMKVSLVPKLSRCIYNGRLEIWPSKDWELESFHSYEVLEMIRGHITRVIGLRANSSVTDNWAMTKITRPNLCQVYVASILFGYFLKAALLRLHLERCLALESKELHRSQRTSILFQEMCPAGLRNLLFGHNRSKRSESYSEEISEDKKPEKLICYVTGFDPDALQRCTKLRSNEALSLIENQSRALFGADKTGLLETDEVILTSFSSLKRLILEAVAFGSFLWDTEDCINTVYKLKEN